jgi:hypothetical protein
MSTNDTVSGWVGWIAFAGLMALIIGAIDMIQGFFAIIEDQKIISTGEGLAIVDVTAWGWFTLLWGGLLIIAGLALLGGAGWARWLAIIGVGLGAIAQMGFLANYPQAYPLWNITILALQIIVLYALVVKWSEYKSATV